MKKTDLIEEALRNAGISELNEMQKKSLETSGMNQDLFLLSPTGSGKTLAFLLPILKTLDKSRQETRVLILAPSRELVLQIAEVFKSFRSSFRIGYCYGGHSLADEKRMLENLPEILVGTPGRIADHLNRRNLSTETIDTLVLDEFDKILELGFTEEVSFIISRLTKLKKRMLISATVLNEIPSFLTLRNPVKLDFLSQKETISGLRFKKVMSPQKDKLETLCLLLNKLENKSTLVFCNYRESVERVEAFLSEKGVSCSMYHGGMEQPDREKSLFLFQSGCSRVLISTDLAARGLDIPAIQHIVHYHLPVNEEAFIHRNGRTARMFADGISFVIQHNDETLPAFMNEDYEEETLPAKSGNITEPEWAALYIGKGKKEKISKGDIAGFLMKKGELRKEDIGKIDVKDRCAYVAVKRTVIDSLIERLEGEKIKGIRTLYKKA